jgi:hypothetical protein
VKFISKKILIETTINSSMKYTKLPEIYIALTPIQLSNSKLIE